MLVERRLREVRADVRSLQLYRKDSLVSGRGRIVLIILGPGNSTSNRFQAIEAGQQ
jgi:hypothetical protein